MGGKIVKILILFHSGESMHRREVPGHPRPFTRRLMQPKSISAQGEKTEKTDRITPNNHTPTKSFIFRAGSLDVSVVGDGGDSLGSVAGSADQVALTGTNGLALQVHMDALFLGLALLQGILLDTVDELLAGAGVLDVLDADANALLEVAVVDALVEEDADRRLGDIVDNTSLPMINFMRHAVRESQLLMFFPERHYL